MQIIKQNQQICLFFSESQTIEQWKPSINFLKYSS